MWLNRIFNQLQGLNIAFLRLINNSGREHKRTHYTILIIIKFDEILLSSFPRENQDQQIIADESCLKSLGVNVVA